MGEKFIQMYAVAVKSGLNPTEGGRAVGVSIKILKETSRYYYVRKPTTHHTEKKERWRLDKQKLANDGFVIKKLPTVPLYKASDPRYKGPLGARLTELKSKLRGTEWLSRDSGVFFSLSLDAPSLIIKYLQEEKRKRVEGAQRKAEEWKRKFEATFLSISPLCYQLLGLNNTAGPEEIKQAYRAKAKLHHPDSGGDPDVFMAIQLCYEDLKGR